MFHLGGAAVHARARVNWSTMSYAKKYTDIIMKCELCGQSVDEEIAKRADCLCQDCYYKVTSLKSPNKFNSIFPAAILVFIAAKVLIEDPADFGSVAFGGSLLLIAGFIVTNLIFAQTYLGVQSNTMKHPYIASLIITCLMGLATISVIWPKIHSLETGIGAIIYSSIIIIVSVVVGILIGRRISLTHKNRHNQAAAHRR